MEFDDLPDINRLNVLLRRRARIYAIWKELNSEIQQIVDQIEEDAKPPVPFSLTANSLPTPDYVRSRNRWSHESLKNKEFILSLFQDHVELSTQYIRERWAAANRAGRVDNVLWQLRKEGMLRKPTSDAKNRLTRKGKTRAAEVSQAMGEE